MQPVNSFLSKLVKVLLIAAAISISQYAFAADVPIPNGGFEAIGKPIPDWNISDSGGSKSQFSIDTTLAHTGHNSLHLIKTNQDGYVELQSKLIPVVAKSTYEVSTWLNSKTMSQANVSFMISQFKPGSDEAGVPNIWSPLRVLYSTSGQWEELKLLFTASQDIDRIRISLIFNTAPIDISVDDFQLNNLGSDYKPRYEPPTPETLMPLADAEKVLLARPRATADVKRIGQRPRLFIDGKESFPAFYLAPAWGGAKSQIKDFNKAGVHVYLIPYVLGRGLYGNFGVWSGKGKTNFDELDDLMWRVLRADPHGYIMFYLDTDPYPTWGAEHPQDVVTDQDGSKVIVDMHFLRWGGEPKITGSPYVERYGYSYVSSALRTDTEKVLFQFDQHIRNSLPGKAVIGYHVLGGQDGQWFAWNNYNSDHLSDYSQASRVAFRDWLKVKYTTISNLCNAWHQPDVTFETVQVPSAKRRLASALFLDPNTEQDIIDYNRFYSEGIVDTLDGYAKTLRKSHGTPIVLGTYDTGPTGPVPSQFATGYLLQKGMFNYVTSVEDYDAIRRPGGPGKAHQAWGSLLLHDTFGLMEEDYRSWKSAPITMVYDNLLARVETTQEYNAILRRDTGHMIAYGQGNWWYDMAGGWFSDPSIMKAVKESTEAYKLDLHNNSFPHADVAVFADEASMDYINVQNRLNIQNTGLNDQIIQLNSSGVPFHIYLQSDISNSKLPDYKLYVFLDAYHLTAEDWSAILKLRRDGKTICFMHAPGVESQHLLGVKSAAAAITKVTGISVVKNGEGKSVLEPNAKSTFDSDDFIYNSNIPIPTFAVNDTNAQAVADYSFDHKIAVAVRDFGSWKSVFYGGVEMSAPFFNALARKAGAWVAAPTGNVVYANQHFLTIHAMYPGNKTVRLFEPSKVTDLADGKVLPQKTQVLELHMKRGETRWFYLE